MEKTLAPEVAAPAQVSGECRAPRTWRTPPPLSRSNFAALRAYVSDHVEEEGCDNTLRHAQTFLAGQALDAASVTAWLKEEGGYCDCEVLYNVADSPSERS
jgi:hypothetical protein